MHSRGRSADMYRHASYGDVVAEVCEELRSSIERAREAGVRMDRIVVDPGLGFAKRAEHSFETLARLPDLASLGRPLLVGASRKSFLKAAVGDVRPDERVHATAAAVTAAVLLGAHIVRVHDVAAMVQVTRTADRLRAAARNGV
jgi:dihydropteroate synthase